MEKTFHYDPAPAARLSVASLLPARQKAPLRQKLHPPHNLNEPLALFIVQLHFLALLAKNLPHEKTKSVFCAKES
ncbi:hypothetical protein [Bacillus thuringiensis]|uniref:hypothetical protein n=1 Tax=Bacillus thuringiensis TaxID=1428 RepID=UPI003F6C0B9A